MTKFVFPTKEQLSYISPVESGFEDSEYLTILSCIGQEIDSVDIIQNPYLDNENKFMEMCKDEHINVVMSPKKNHLPIKELQENGISVYKVDTNKKVLNIFSDFVQDKLERLNS
ncbi:NifB/NifX family molybdenum-iron cluster-binding protein [Halarcobacter anaerophilus]|jgi:predicted Fe-Mo cluster-binding NifX family protein|uniref:Dinitrogenase iron-molybdenum cofactor biosynthesis domain-containing protein n=1 Tax=Halarcobacter anaerophilus TaxID=877500 RepID=A0A4Q0XZA5_9BACT|nr:NifB/NifX family molybdenum-iron cluster-binding protein [Halarcobacter anaerophilus]QDF29710.1 hypothetical protein AANAER_2251 [Halarcobacter anaerophilus]RXJ62633.1 hypothetical protein CRV06_09200 [Halarcobacter anaerophilus]